MKTLSIVRQHLVPRPKCVHIGAGHIDRFHVKDAGRFHSAVLPSWGAEEDRRGTPVRMHLWRNLAKEQRALFPPEAVRLATDPEAYAIRFRAEDGWIAGGSDHGLQHALATLRQLRQLAADTGEAMPEMTIVDWPDTAIRGAHICYHLVREWMPYSAPNFEELVRSLERFAQCKLNTVLLELEALFPFQRHREASVSFAFSPAQIAQIVAACKALHLNLIPKVQCLGHQYYLLRHERYAALRETPDINRQLCLTNPDSVKLVLDLVDEHREQMPGLTHFHLGGDEARNLGHCARCRAKADRDGLSALYTDHVAAVCEGALQRGLTPMLWSDMLEHHPECLQRIPKETMIVYWNYDFRKWPRPYALPQFVKAGYRTVGCSAVRFGAPVAHVAVNYEPALNGIADLSAAALRDGACGMIVSNWTKAIPYELCWRGYLFQAAEAWTPGGDRAEFDRAFAAWWYGLRGDAVDALMKAFSDLAIRVPYAEDTGCRNRGLSRLDLTGLPVGKRIARYTSPAERSKTLGLLETALHCAKSAAQQLAVVRPSLRRNAREWQLLDLGARTLDHKARMGMSFDRFAVWQRGEIQLNNDERAALRSEIRRLKDEWARLQDETRQLLAETHFRESALALAGMKFERETFEELENRERILMEEERSATPGLFARTWKLERLAAVKMPYLETRGTAFDRGYAQGDALRSLVELGVRTWLSKVTLTERQEQLLKNSQEYVRKEFPDLWKELNGLSQGAQIPFDTLYRLNAFNAARCCCTALAVAGTNGEVLLGNTADIDVTQRQFYFVHRASCEAGLQLLTLHWAGFLWPHAGINSAGLAIGTTSTSKLPNQHGFGLPQHITPHLVLTQCRNVPDALALLSRTTLMGKGIGMVLADREGRVVSMEKSFDCQGIVQTTGVSLFRTNHFISPEMIRFNPEGPGCGDNSRARYERLAKTLAAGRVDAPQRMMMELLRTHGEGGLCQHIPTLDTLAAVVMNPREGWMEVCGGKPCVEPFQRFEFKST
ncbi:MAG: family 20 glycosylhydrolase [Verrucomicrobia bacterium]|nr:family 20 glycosylhydrolase [Verrucomicrobiota bacterium]